MHAQCEHVLFSPTGDRIHKARFFFLNVVFIENSIQNHARNVDVRNINKSQKTYATMEPKSIQTQVKLHSQIDLGKTPSREKSRPGAPKGRKCRCGPLAREIERSRTGLAWSHTPVGRWPGELLLLFQFSRNLQVFSRNCSFLGSSITTHITGPQIG